METGDLTSDQFLALHRHQLESVGVPRQYWKTLSTKVLNEVYDAGDYFTMFYDDAQTSKWKVAVTHPSGITPNDPNSIFLVDHAWSFELGYARKQLLAIPGLLNRMVTLMGCLSPDGDKDVYDDGKKEEEIDYINNDDEGRHAEVFKAVPAKHETSASTDTDKTDSMIGIVLDEMWRYVQSYRLGNGVILVVHILQFNNCLFLCHQTAACLYLMICDGILNCDAL